MPMIFINNAKLTQKYWNSSKEVIIPEIWQQTLKAVDQTSLTISTMLK